MQWYKPPIGSPRVILALATGLGLGYAPFASGTFGSLLAIPIYLVARPLGDSPFLVAILLIAFIGVACWIAGRADELLGEHDSGKIVIDEIAGMLVTLVGHPPTASRILAAFLAFRLFDIVKPWPASAFDRSMEGGPGVVLDDVVSGVYANLAVHGLFWLMS